MKQSYVLMNGKNPDKPVEVYRSKQKAIDGLAWYQHGSGNLKAYLDSVTFIEDIPEEHGTHRLEFIYDPVTDDFTNKFDPCIHTSVVGYRCIAHCSICGKQSEPKATKQDAIDELEEMPCK